MLTIEDFWDTIVFVC